MSNPDPIVTPIARSSGPIPCLIPTAVPHAAHGGCPGRPQLLAADTYLDAYTASVVDMAAMGRQYGPATVAQYYPVAPTPTPTQGQAGA